MGAPEDVIVDAGAGATWGGIWDGTLGGVLLGVFWHQPHPTIYGLVEVVEEEGVVGVHLKTQVQAQVLRVVPLGTAPLGVVHETLFGPDFG